MLKVIVGKGEPLGLALVTRGDVGPGQPVQALQQGAGVCDVAADGGIGPAGVAVAVETHVKLHEPRHGLDGVVVEAQGLHAFCGQFGAHHVVVAEAHRAARFETARRRLPDVVHERGEAQHKVRTRHRAVRARLKRRSLLQDLQGVLVDVLVPVVLIGFKAQRGDLGEDEFGQSGFHEEVDARTRVRTVNELDEFLAHAFGGNDLDPLGHPGHGEADVVVHGNAELRGETGSTHHAQGIIGE